MVGVAPRGRGPRVTQRKTSTGRAGWALAPAGRLLLRAAPRPLFQMHPLSCPYHKVCRGEAGADEEAVALPRAALLVVPRQLRL
jgi:hypothetical protein